jgi:hypothetical protein
MRSTAFPAVSLIPRWLVPSFTLPRVLAPTWLSHQVFSRDSSISGGKWKDSHWKYKAPLTLHSRGDRPLSHLRWRLGKADHPCDMGRQTGHRPRPCPFTQPLSSAHGQHYSYLRLAPLRLDVSSLPQLLSLLSRFNLPTNLYHHQSIRRQPPAHGRV